MFTLLDSVPFVLFLGVLASLIAIMISNWVGPKAKSLNAKYHMDSVSMSLIDRAVSILPKSQRELSREEWYAHLLDIEPPTLRLTHAVNCIRAAMIISSEVYVLAPVGQAISSRAVKIAAGFSTFRVKLFDRLTLTAMRYESIRLFVEIFFSPAKVILALFLIFMDRRTLFHKKKLYKILFKDCFYVVLGTIIIFTTTRILKIFLPLMNNLI